MENNGFVNNRNPPWAGYRDLARRHSPALDGGVPLQESFGFAQDSEFIELQGDSWQGIEPMATGSLQHCLVSTPPCQSRTPRGHR